MKIMKQLDDYLPIGSEGLFTSFVNPIWVVDFPDTEELDIYFILNYGERIGSKLIDYYADETDGTVKGENLFALAKMVYNLNAKKWEHLYGVYKSQYNPIENTDFIETISDTTTNNRVGNSQSHNNGTSTTTGSGTVTGSNSNDTGVYGFNSASAVGERTAAGSNTDTTSTTSTTTSANDNTDTDTVNDLGTHKSEHRKHGNIGVTENVTMLEHEVDFWKWSFIDDVCKDICKIIALSIY